MSFDSLGLSAELLRALETQGYSEPTPIQAKAIPHVLEGQPFVHPDAMGADRHHEFKVLSLDARDCRILWERTAWEGRPGAAPLRGPSGGSSRGDGPGA